MSGRHRGYWNTVTIRHCQGCSDSRSSAACFCGGRFRYRRYVYTKSCVRSTTHEALSCSNRQNVPSLTPTIHAHANAEPYIPFHAKCGTDATRHAAPGPCPPPLGSSKRCGLMNPSSICLNAPAGSSDKSEMSCVMAPVALATLLCSTLPARPSW